MIDTIVSETKIPVVTIVTKSDLLTEKERKKFKNVLFVSNITREGIESLVATLGAQLPI